MVLNGFVDDSGSGGGPTRGNIFVLSGFIASAERWEKFSDEWVEICGRDPKTPDFHMKRDYRLLNDDGSLKWTETQRDTRIKELVELIKLRAQYRVDCVVAWPNYEKIVLGKVPSEIDNPYFLLFYGIIISFAEYMDKFNIEGTVDWVFDDQGRIGNEVNAWYDFIKANVEERIRRRLGSKPIFRHDNNVIPLKAADIFSWQIRRHLDREQPQNIPHNDYIDSLLGMFGVSNIIEPQYLEEYVWHSQTGQGLTLKTGTQFFTPRVQSSPDEGSSKT